MPSKGRGMAVGFRLGDNNALCDRCQRKFWASDLKKEWTGFIVCESCYDPRHPQEFLRGHPDNQSVEDARPDTKDIDIEYNGDEGKALTKNVNSDIQVWNETLTEDRVVILSSDGAQQGDRITIQKNNPDEILYITSTILDSGITI